MLRLRSDVQLRQEAGGWLLRDEATALEAVIGEDEAAVVRLLGLKASTEDVVASLVDADRELDRNSALSAVREFTSRLAALGLLDENLPVGDIRKRQAAFFLAEREEAALEQIVTVLQLAFDQCSFHRRRIEASGASRDAISRQTFLAMPTMDKRDVRREFPSGLVPDDDGLKARLAAGDLSLFATSGTTDDRLEVLFDWTLGQLPATYPRLWKIPAGALSRGAVFTTPICAGFECTLGLKDRSERVRGVTITLNSVPNLFSMTEELVRSFLEDVAWFKPDLLFVNPAYAAMLVRTAERHAIELPGFKVVLASYQFLTHQERRLLSRAFRAPVFSYYGATDLGGALVGAECVCGRMHERNDLVHLEIVGEDGKVLPPGRPGRIAVTTLRNGHLPLIRYLLGDLGILDEDPCDCDAAGDSRTFRLLGRAADVVAMSDGRRLTCSDVNAALAHVDGIDLYRLTRVAPGCFEASFVASPGVDGNAVGQEVVGALRNLFRADIDVTARSVHRLPQERSLKTRLLCPT